MTFVYNHQYNVKRWHDYMLRAAESSAYLAKATGNKEWIDVINLLKLIYTMGLQVADSKQMSRSDALQMLDEREIILKSRQDG